MLMLCLFLFHGRKYYTITTIKPWSQFLGKKKNILHHYLLDDKNIQNCKQNIAGSLI